jgi:hypothetical protein
VFCFIWSVGTVIHVCACNRSAYIGINERLNAAMSLYPHLAPKVLSLSSAGVPNCPFWGNVTPTSDEGLLRLVENTNCGASH